MTPPHVTIKLTINEAEAACDALYCFQPISEEPRAERDARWRAHDKIDRAVQAKFVAGMEKR